MKVILLKDVKDIGPSDTIANVSDGFARNYLFPNKLATAANEESLKLLESRVKSLEVKREEERKSLMSVASKLENLQIDIAMDTGEGGKLFGSVTATDISKKIYESLGVEIDKKKIVMEEHIKSAGIHTVHIKFATEISAKIKVNVIPASK